MTSERTSFRRRARRRLRLAVGLTTALVAPGVLGVGPAHAAAVTIDLCALPGSTTPPAGTAVTIWTYASGTCTGATAPTAPGGPTLVVTQGDVVTVNLHNALGEVSGLQFQGQGLALAAGAPAGTLASPGTKSYTFTASAPGTYLYEAAPLANAQHQVAMGLYGALVVRPAVAGSAYGTTATQYATDAVVLLSELDPALNNRTTAATATVPAGPAGFDMRNYKAKYRLVNGRAHPASASIGATAGSRLLLRYVNAGIDSHSLGLLGLRQTFVANDGNAYAYPRVSVAETLGAGQTMDAVVTVPATAATGTRYPLYDASLSLHNNTQLGTLGSALTTIDVVGGATAPLVTSLVATATGFTGSITATSPATVAGAEWYLDTTPGAPGTGTAVTGLAGTTAPVAVTYPAVTGLGTHVVHLRGRDSTGLWGPVVSATFTVAPADQQAPTTTGPTFAPAVVTPTTAVTVSATASDATTGASAIAAAEYTLDYGAAVAMTVTATGPSTATLSASIPAGLVIGDHTVSVRSRDAAGNWSAPVTATLPVVAAADGTGPVTTAVSASPNPNNGSFGFNASVAAIRVFATVTDAVSNVATAEGFLDPASAPGIGVRGFTFVAADGAFDEKVEDVYADIPLTTTSGLAVGNHTIGVRGRDAAGNWTTALVSTTLVIERTAPSVVGITRAAASPTSAPTVTFTVTFSEPVIGISPSSFTVVRTGGLTGASIQSISGSGATRTVTVSTGANGGTLGLNLTSAAGITDVAGNALPATGLPVVGQTYTVLTPPLYFSTAGNSNPPGVGGSADDADVYLWNGSAFSRSIDVTAIPAPVPAGANVDGLDRVDATHVYLSFTGNVTLPVIGTVQDEDVVFYNAGTWSVFFDGTANGLGSSDIDAISVVGGTLYFSLDSGLLPPGVTGTGDDADVYRWNGSTFARVVDASGAGSLLGLPGGANVDGLVVVDATHVYLSFAADVNVPGYGTVQDEDVVFYNAGTWSTYFDGTARGLTSNALSVDAFDLP